MCEYCMSSGGHAPGCPNGDPPSDYTRCAECGDEIRVLEGKRLTPYSPLLCEGCYEEMIERLCAEEEEE